MARQSQRPPAPSLWLLAFFILASAWLNDVISARAQGGTAALVSSPVTIADFPRISTYLSVLDQEGRFAHGLTIEAVRVLEDGFELPVSEMVEQHPGVQFALAISPGPSFDIRDVQGVTRYQYLSEAMLSWQWEESPQGMDDLSLVTPEGDLILHTDSPGELISALQDYQPGGQDAVASLQALVRALDTISNGPARPGMGAAILFITAPQSEDVAEGLLTLAARATQQGVRIYVWVIAAPEVLGTPEILPLQALAEQTGGHLQGFSGSEILPELDSLLEPLRHSYYITYTSQVNSSGEHQVTFLATVGDEQATSPVQTFDIDLQAPIPSLVALPLEIQRTFATQTTPASVDSPPELTPEEQDVQINITFPDGYERPLERTALYIDGELIAENTVEPFDLFSWDLRGYQEAGTHSLKVEVVDSLGLSSQSSEVNVQIGVPRPEQGIVAALERQRGLVIGIIVLICGAVLALVLVVGGRIQPRAVLGRQFVRKRSASGRSHRKPSSVQGMPASTDPVTQIVEILDEANPQDRRRWDSWVEHLPWTQRQTIPKPAAYLTPLSGMEDATLTAPYPIGSEEVTLGQDEKQATFVVNDPSVDPIHALLKREDGSYWLSDAGSTAGTWVNYAPISEQGKALAHNDLIHIGRIGFRFTLREPGQMRKPIAIPQEREP
ncbi:MAG: FHA domain-containing protein [Anaerolineales bacterium]|nr:FHA domain-containing protein [Anaerolineales bacterium]